MKYKLTPMLVLFAAVAGAQTASAQPAPPRPATAAPPAQTPPQASGQQSVADLRRQTADLMAQVEQNLEPQKKLYDAVLKQLDDRIKAVEDADQLVTALLTGLREAQERGRPDGPLMERTNRLLKITMDLSSQADNDNDTIFAEAFKKQAEGFRSLQEQLNAGYADSLKTIRELEAKRRTLVRAKQYGELEVAYDVLKGAVDNYKNQMDMAQGLKTAVGVLAPPKPRM